jgi:hypothetical protein
MPDGTWNVNRVQLYFSPEDAEEILKIETSRRNESDFVAWYPEKRGIFTVRSAYRLALNRVMQERNWGASSTRPDGERPDWNVIWKSPVPPKVKLLNWKICRNGLATQENMMTRGIATTSVCQLCGQGREDTFHVFIRCPHARALWLAMREEWDLPADYMLQPTGPEWLLRLLNSIPNKQQIRTMLTMWRIWHNHNEMTHEKPCPSIEGSRRHLVSYLNSLCLIKQFPDADLEKGKMVVGHDVNWGSKPKNKSGGQKTKQAWIPPEEGYMKS